MDATLKTNKVFELLQDSDKRITVMQGGSRCFTGETLVQTIDGPIPISDITIGQPLYCIDKKGNTIIRKVVDKFIYKADHTKHNVVTFVMKDTKITCTYQHKLLQNDGYVRAFDIAIGMLATGSWYKWPIPDQQSWEVTRDAVQKQERSGWYADYETSQGCQWVLENYDTNRWTLQNDKDAPIGSGTFCRESTGKTSSKPHQQQERRQQSDELGVGDIQREFGSYDGTRPTDFQQWREEWEKHTYFRYCKVDTNGIQTLCGDGQRVGSQIWGENVNHQRHTQGKKLEIGDVSEIIFHQTTETVYDIEVEDYHNYFVTNHNIISHNSGKTYNILIWFVIKLLQENGKILTIARQSLPSIKGTVLRDFVDILMRLGIYTENNHNKTDNIYHLNNNVVEFVSADQPQKIRGRRRDYLFCNEANELSYDTWMQLIMRTEGKAVIDYNPSDLNSFIYDHVIPRDDADFYITTFRDNPFLAKDLVDELERLKDADPNYWRIYGLGERGLSQDLIYTHWKTTEAMPTDGEVVYGLDFGFNVPSALVKVVFHEGAAYCEELIYEPKLTTDDLIQRILALGIDRNDDLYCDAAEPKTIESLVRAGLNAKPANKDVTEGIKMVKATPLFIHIDSIHLLKELRNYRWKTDRNGNTLDTPVKFADHISDALRYAIFSKLTIPKITWGAI